MAPVFSIIIPLFRTENLAQIIDHLNSHINEPKEFEIIIINDNSWQKITNVDSKIKLIIINNNKNMGRGYSRNLGISKAKGTYLIFFDDDIVTEQEFFSKLKNVNLEEYSVYITKILTSKKNIINIYFILLFYFGIQLGIIPFYGVIINKNKFTKLQLYENNNNLIKNLALEDFYFSLKLNKNEIISDESLIVYHQNITLNGLLSRMIYYLYGFIISFSFLNIKSIKIINKFSLKKYYNITLYKKIILIIIFTIHMLLLFLYLPIFILKYIIITLKTLFFK